MTAFRILALCISAAFVCASIRAVHPQIATAVALAAGVAAMMISVEDIGSLSRAIDALEAYAPHAENGRPNLMKICAIAMIAEFASDICRDAGEASLARRIDVGVRIGVAVSALPTAGAILEKLVSILS